MSFSLLGYCEATDFVDNLSNVYRFILESGSTNLIAIEKELKFAKAYVYIQSERFGDNLQLHWNIPEDQLLSACDRVLQGTNSNLGYQSFQGRRPN